MTTQALRITPADSWVKSNHTYKFGSEFRTENYYAYGYMEPTAVIPSRPTTGQPFQTTAVGGANVGLGYADFPIGPGQSSQH